MAPAFSKEAILQGSVDHLCLVCESYLRSEREVCLHVSTPTHRRNLDSTDFVEKYRIDRVRKIKKWYFCEFCNVLVSTITKVRLHVEDPKHKENMSSQMIARVDDTIVSGNIAISEEAWHGFIDDNTCAICNVEFEDKFDHRNELPHIINLIQSKVSSDFNNAYRKIDDSTFHCLTCNVIVAAITAHLDDVTHKNLVQKCTKTNPSIVDNCEKENLVDKSSSRSINEDNIVEDNKKSDKNSDSCLVTKTPVNNTFKEVETDVMNEEHINEPHANKYITCDQSGKTTCTLCECDFDPLHIKIHLDGLNHRNMLKKSKNLKDDIEHTSDILEYIPKFRAEAIDIILESRSAVCRKCSVKLELNAKIIENHIMLHKNKLEQNSGLNKQPTLFAKDEKNKPTDNGTLFKSPSVRSVETDNKKNVHTKSTETAKQKCDIAIKKMADVHGLSYTDNKLYCQRCKKHIPESVRNINEHVNGECHRSNIELVSKPTSLKDNESKTINTKKYNLHKVPLQQFVRLMTTVKNMFAEDVVINEKYCINLLAFTFLTMTEPGRLRCLVCEVNLNLPDIKNHVDVKRHQRALNEVPIIIHTDSELIREIRSEVFQCGFCNIIDSWEGMENHLKSTSHKESKTFANWRLSQHLPQIEQHNVDRQICNEFMMRLMFS